MPMSVFQPDSPTPPSSTPSPTTRFALTRLSALARKRDKHRRHVSLSVVERLPYLRAAELLYATTVCLTDRREEPPLVVNESGDPACPREISAPASFKCFGPVQLSVFASNIEDPLAPPRIHRPSSRWE